MSVFGLKERGVYCDYAFVADADLDLSQSVKLRKIGKGAFYLSQKDPLVSVKLPEARDDLQPALEIIDDIAFRGAPIETLTIENLPNLKEIGRSAFAFGKQMKNLTLRNLPALEMVGSNAFGYQELTEVVFENVPKLVTMAANTFEKNPGVKKVDNKVIVWNLPKENNKLASKATFVVNPDLTADGSYKPEDFVYGYYGTNNEYWAIVGLSETGAGKLALGNKNINFPGADPEGRPVTAFAADLRECLTQRTSPVTELQVIGKEAFYKSTVNEFNFRALPNLCFDRRKCLSIPKLERADLKIYIWKISIDVFEIHKQVVSMFDNNDNLTDIEKWAFESARLTDIIFGNLPSLKTLGVASFGVASNISYLGSPEVITTLNQPIDLSGAPNLEVFGGEVFRRRKMDSINLTGLDKVKVIGYGAFSETKLKHFNFSEVPNVEAIQSSAFKETQLKQVDFAPLKNLREIGSYAFLNASVENINWGEDSKLESIGWEAFSKNNIKELDLSSLKYLSNISGHAFEKNKLENLIYHRRRRSHR